jgi:hypothetical protein
MAVHAPRRGPCLTLPYSDKCIAFPVFWVGKKKEFEIDSMLPSNIQAVVVK